MYNKNGRENGPLVLKSGAEQPSTDHPSTTDAAGYWFAAAALIAFLSAGVIVYRTGNLNPVNRAPEVQVSQAAVMPPAPAIPR